MTSLATSSVEDLRSILLTCDGRGKEAKEDALEELLRRARRDGGTLDYELIQDLKRS